MTQEEEVRRAALQRDGTFDPCFDLPSVAKAVKLISPGTSDATLIFKASCIHVCLVGPDVPANPAPAVAEELIRAHILTCPQGDCRSPNVSLAPE